MKFTATKERRRLREEFVYKYALEIASIYAGKKYNQYAEKAIEFVKNVARKELEYSSTTGDRDVFNILKRTHQSIFK